MALAQTIQRPGADVVTIFNELGLAAKRGTAGASPPSALPRERAVLYDKDVTDPKGKHYEGTVVWRTEESKASSTQAGNRACCASTSKSPSVS